MSGIRLAAQHREYGRGSPFLLLRALDNPQAVTAIEDQRLGEQSLPAIAFNAGHDALHRPVRPHHQAAGGGAHARRRPHLRRQRLRRRARRLEVRRRRADRAFALVPPRRARDAASHLQGGDGEPDDRDGDVRGAGEIPNGRARLGQRRRALSMGAAADVPRPASSTATPSTSRPAAASSWSSSRPTCSTWSAAPPTT